MGAVQAIQSTTPQVDNLVTQGVDWGLLWGRNKHIHSGEVVKKFHQ
jgi:hypothetical protein